MSDYIIHDTTLTSIANAIRTKTGSNVQMTPSEMATAIGNISTGGGSGFTLDDLAHGRVTGDVLFNDSVCSVCWSGQAITSFSAPNLIAFLLQYPFISCTALTSISIPNVQTCPVGMCSGNSALVNVDISSVTSVNSSAFAQCTSLQQIVAPKATTISSGAFSGCSGLQVAIFPKVSGPSAFGSTCFSNCSNLSTLVLGSTTLVPLRYAAAFNYSSLASGGSGCTIYVPNDLIASYKTASNWSTFYGYGTITWAAIEGSPYEQYKQTT